MPEPSPGSVIAHYRIISKIGAGGMGEVWRARDPQLGRDVAIKLLSEAFSADKDRLARFEQEVPTDSALIIQHHRRKSFGVAPPRPDST